MRRIESGVAKARHFWKPPINKRTRLTRRHPHSAIAPRRANSVAGIAWPALKRTRLKRNAARLLRRCRIAQSVFLLQLVLSLFGQIDHLGRFIGEIFYVGITPILCLCLKFGKVLFVVRLGEQSKPRSSFGDILLVRALHTRCHVFVAVVSFVNLFHATE